MTVKVTVKTEDFEVELPCEMECRDLDTNPWVRLEIYTYDENVGYPWRLTNGGGYRYARPIPKPKMIPWTIEDFKVGMVVRSIKNSRNTFLVIGVADSVQIGLESYELDDVFEFYAQEDGTPFEKEST